MSSIIHRNINGTTYLIESKSYRDSKGRPRTKQRCLGHFDKDGVLIASKGRKHFPAEIHKVRTVVDKYIIVPMKEKKIRKRNSDSITTDKNFSQAKESQTHGEICSKTHDSLQDVISPDENISRVDSGNLQDIKLVGLKHRTLEENCEKRGTLYAKIIAVPENAGKLRRLVDKNLYININYSSEEITSCVKNYIKIANSQKNRIKTQL